MSDTMNDKEILANQYPSNSKIRPAKSPDSTPEDNRQKKVVTGLVKTQKRSFGKKVAETFLEDDTKSVGSYILHDVIIPAAKTLISDMVGGGIEMLLFGDRRPRSSTIRRDGGKSYTNYGGYSSPSYKDNRDRDRRELSPSARSRHNFDEIIMSSRGDAEEVLSRLVDQTIDYGQATVADLYDLVGITGSFTDNKWGWTDLHTATISRYRGGYLINLPRTQPLD